MPAADALGTAVCYRRFRVRSTDRFSAGCLSPHVDSICYLRSLAKRERFVAAMAVHDVRPRKWHADEVELLQTVASRCWESIERARAEAELRIQWRSFDTLISNVP